MIGFIQVVVLFIAVIAFIEIADRVLSKFADWLREE